MSLTYLYHISSAQTVHTAIQVYIQIGLSSNLVSFDKNWINSRHMIDYNCNQSYQHYIL